MTWMYRLTWIFSRCLFLTYFRYRSYHPERVPRSGPVILASNHASYLDPLVVGAPLSRMVNFLARDTLFNSPVLAWYLNRCRVVPVDRDGRGPAGMKAILQRLAMGEIILLFPEGTRTLTGELQPGHSGIGWIVVKSEAPVVPVRNFGTFEALGRHGWFPKPSRLAVKYGKPLDFSAARAEVQVCSKPRAREIHQLVTDQIMAAIAALEPRVDGEPGGS
jgi:1-acyl-sn-glycerol-3-phosphate acyltransferase